MEHKVKIVEVLERHKIHPKVNAHMNMHFCHMISKLVVRPPSRSMCLRWNMCSKWVIENATKFYMFLPQIGRVRRHLLQITSMNVNEDLQRFNGRMFCVWDGNHRL
jgi:hypothetical protein